MPKTLCFFWTQFDELHEFWEDLVILNTKFVRIGTFLIAPLWGEQGFPADVGVPIFPIGTRKNIIAKEQQQPRTPPARRFGFGLCMENVDLFGFV